MPFTHKHINGVSSATRKLPRKRGYGPTLRLFPTGQTFVPNIVIVVIRYDGTHGGLVSRGVTAHGSPGGPLQFGRLEATLAAKFP